MKTFKFLLVLRTGENTDDSITLYDNIYGIHSKRVNILYLSIRYPILSGTMEGLQFLRTAWLTYSTWVTVQSHFAMSN